MIILAPTYNDSAALCKIYQESLSVQKVDITKFIAVDDGSSEIFKREEVFGENSNGLVLRLKCNVGHQRAIAIGVEYVSKNFPGEVLLVMDGDGEDSPFDIVELLKHYDESKYDVIVAKRGVRQDGAFYNLMYLGYKLIFRVLTGQILDFGNFMLLSPRAVKSLGAKNECGIHMAATVLNSRLRIFKVSIDKRVRIHGHSKMNARSLILHGFRSITIFMDDVLLRTFSISTALAFICLMVIPLPLILKFYEKSTPGWASSLMGIFFGLFIQLSFISLISLLLVGLSKNKSSNVGLSLIEGEE
jgi:glycosyltransferase involved in cell wall biosynthesis